MVILIGQLIILEILNKIYNMSMIIWALMVLPISFGFHCFIIEGDWKKRKDYFGLWILATIVWLSYLTNF